MKKAFSTTRLNLPLIHPIKTNTTTVHASSHVDPSEAQQVSELEKWTCQKDPKTKRSKVVAAVYRESIGRRMKQRQLTENGQIMESRLFLMRLESELKKAHDINYQAIYKNIEFCSGIYENAYGCLLREIAKLQTGLRNRMEEIEECLRGERLQHIRSMEKLDEKENYKTQIPAVRKAIEDRQAELEPLHALVDDLEAARKTVLRRCLAHGYDVREEGLLWILRQLGEDVNHEDFPKFLNEKEIEYLMGKYKKEQEASVQTETQSLLGVAPQKSKGQIIDIISRKKKRDFTMAHEVAMLQELKAKQTMKLNSQRHQLISNQVLRMAKEQLAVTKATRYELVYREAVRKLNKFCSDQIHNKQRPSNSQEQQRRVSSSTLKILSCFDAKVEDYIKEITHPPQPKVQQVALDDILRQLRYESYHMGEKTTRNAVSVVACLVGWKKAKKLIENELNSLL